MKHQFWIYQSVEHWYLRLLIAFFPFLIAAEAYVMDFPFLYFVSIIMLIVSLYVYSFVNSRMMFSEKGITVIRWLKSNLFIPWEEVKQMDSFEMRYLGSCNARTVVFFSKNTVNAYQLSKNKSLPVLATDFVFVLDQPGLKEAILQYAPSNLLNQVNW